MLLLLQPLVLNPEFYLLFNLHENHHFYSKVKIVEPFPWDFCPQGQYGRVLAITEGGGGHPPQEQPASNVPGRAHP